MLKKKSINIFDYSTHSAIEKPFVVRLAILSIDFWCSSLNRDELDELVMSARYWKSGDFNNFPLRFRIHWIAIANVSISTSLPLSLMNLNCRRIPPYALQHFLFPIVRATGLLCQMRCACLTSSTRFIHSEEREEKEKHREKLHHFQLLASSTRCSSRKTELPEQYAIASRTAAEQSLSVRA